MRQNTHQELNSQQFKMRLLAEGHMQRSRIDYFEIIAPVYSAKAITTILSISASEDYEPRSYDLEAAYLQALIDTPTFVKLPALHPTHPNATVQLNKNPYGLAVSGPNCNREIH